MDGEIDLFINAYLKWITLPQTKNRIQEHKGKDFAEYFFV